MAVAYVQRLGGGNSAAASAFVTFSLSATPSGSNTVLVALFALRVATFTVADSKSGTWTRMGVNTNGTACQVEVWARSGGSALVSADTITVTCGGAQKGAVAFEASGLAAAASLADQSAGGTGTGTALATSATPTLAQADELACAVFAEHAGGSDTFTWAGSFTGIVGPGNPFASTCFPGYRVLSSTAAVTASGTLSTSRAWTGLVVTLKGAAPASARRPAPAVIA